MYKHAGVLFQLHNLHNLMRRQLNLYFQGCLPLSALSDSVNEIGEKIVSVCEKGEAATNGQLED